MTTIRKILSVAAILTFASFTILVACLLVGGCSDSTVLHIYTWADYFNPKCIEDFEKTHNCKVVIDTFDSNEAMYAKIKSGATGYDIITPTTYQIPAMVNEDLICPIDQSQIPNVVANYDVSYDRYVYSPSLSVSVPYSFSFAGIVYDRKVVTEEEASSWAVYDNPKLSGRTMLLSDIREVIGAGLMYNGFSINTTSQKEIDIAVETVRRWKRNVRKFDSESYKTDVPSGSIHVGHGYSGDCVQVILGDGESGTRDDIGFAYPKEGFTASCDEFVVMKSSNNKNLAFSFINYMFIKSVCSANMEYIASVTPHSSAIDALPAELRKLIIPDASVMRKCQIIRSFEDRPEVMEMYNKAWEKIISTKE